MDSHRRGAVALAALLGVVSLACSSSSGPSGPKGVAGAWVVTVDAFDEPTRGSCGFSPPSFTVTIDSSAQALTVSSPASFQLVCPATSSYLLTLLDTLGTLGPDPAMVFRAPGTEFIGIGLATIADDSLAGTLVDIDTAGSGTTLGTSTWTAHRP